MEYAKIECNKREKGLGSARLTLTPFEKSALACAGRINDSHLTGGTARHGTARDGTGKARERNGSGAARAYLLKKALQLSHVIASKLYPSA